MFDCVPFALTRVKTIFVPSGDQRVKNKRSTSGQRAHRRMKVRSLAGAARCHRR
jgi:hypothetical protein